MADKIKYNDIVDKNVHENLDALSKQLEEINKQMSSISKIKIKPTKQTTGADFKKEEENIKKVKKATIELTAVQKEKIRLEKAIIREQAKRDESLKNLNKQLITEKNTTKKSTQEIKNASSSYAQLSAKLNETRKKAKDLAIQFGTNSEAFKKAQKEVIELDSKIKNVDKSLGQSQRNVGNYPKPLLVAGKAFKGFWAILKVNPIGVIIALITGLLAFMKKALKPIQPLMDWIADKIAYVEGVVDGFLNSLTRIKDIIKLVFEGEFRAAAKQATELAKQIGNVGDATEKLNKINREADIQQKLNDVTTARVLGHMKDLRTIINDTNASYKDRKKALDELRKMETSQAQDDLNVALNRQLGLEEKINSELVIRQKRFNVLNATEEELADARRSGIITEDEYNDILNARINTYRQIEIRQAVNTKLQLLQNRIANAGLKEQKEAEEEKLKRLKETKNITIQTSKTITDVLKEEEEKRVESTNNKLDAFVEAEKKKTDAINERIKAEQAANEERIKKANEFGKAAGKIFADYINDQEATFGDYLKNIAILLLDSLEKTVLAAIAETTIKQLASKGLFGLATAAGINALIIATFETAKAGIMSLNDGTEYVGLNGNKKGIDTVPAMLNEGERVLTTNQNTLINKAYGRQISNNEAAQILINNANGLNNDTYLFDNSKLEKNTKEISRKMDNKIIDNKNYTIQIYGRHKKIIRYK